MANIAQFINVLQAMILTKDDQIVKTPTFYVFKMYKVHQDATLLPINVTCDEYTYDGMTLPSVSASASQDKEGRIHISLTNIDPHKNRSIEIDLKGIDKLSNATGEIITSPNMNDYNDFGQPEKVNIQKFSSFSLQNNILKVDLPSKSVVTIEIKK
jgi:alpha-N-arabinofuranosidase